MDARWTFAILLGMILLFGCTGIAPGGEGGGAAGAGAQGGSQQGAGQASGSQLPASGVQNQTPSSSSGATENATQGTGNGTPGTGTPGTGGDDLLLLGRSVSQGWAEYMGLQWDESGTMSGTYQGYKIRRYEVESPPGIADSAITGIDAFDSKVVFFKLCFVDFWSDMGSTQLAENEGYVEKVYGEVVTKKHRKLIVGNALPQVSADSSPELVANHKAYNEWLDDFASTHADVYVLDLNSMLVDSNGALRPDYANSAYDSHLNSKAYSVITPKLMELLATAEAG